MKKFLVVKRPHFLYRLFPVHHQTHAVRRHEHAIAISAKPAVYENLSPWSFTHQCKKLCTCSSRGAVQPVLECSPAAFQRLRVRAFFLHQTVPFSAQIDDGVDSSFFSSSIPSCFGCAHDTNIHSPSRNP